jgi:anaerobic selenocysteine-containing dehydrogenase
MPEHKTFCRICVACCGVIVTTEGTTVTAVRGDRDHPLSQGYTCPKGRAIPQAHHRGDRLDVPWRRRAGELVATDWADCLDDLGTKLRAVVERHGPAAVGFFNGSGGYFDSASLYTLYAMKAAIGTPSMYSDNTVDTISTMAVGELVSGIPGLLGKPDLDANRLLIVVGSNPVVSHGQTMMMANPVVRLREFAAHGELWVLDPRRTETTRLATGHLAARPGTDHAVFGFLVRELLRSGADHDYLARHTRGLDDLQAAVEAFTCEHASEMTGVPTAQLAALLEAVRRAGRVAVLTGTGLSMADDANVANWFIWALEIVTRSADHPGGLWFTPSFFFQWDRAGLPQLPPTGSRAPGPPSRPELSSWMGEYPCAAMADEIEAGNLRALIVTGGNPALNLPNHSRLVAALPQLEVLAVADVVSTETTSLATHVLPCTGHLERADLTYIHDTMLPWVGCQYTPAVLPSGASRRPMWWVLARVARELGHTVLPPSIDVDTATDDDVLAVMLQSARADLDELRTAAADGRPVIVDTEVFGWLHDRGLPDGRWRLAPPELVAELDRRRRPAPLVLVPRRQSRHQNTQHRGLGDRPDILVNPEDAAAAGIDDGAEVVVTSAVGSVTGRACVTEDILAGAVSIPHGWAEPCVNVLISDTDVDLLSGMPRQGGTPVSLAPLAG